MLNEKELKALERLCRIYLSPAEEGELLHNLQNILNAVEKLKEVDTESVEPCSHVLEDMIAPLREDVAERLLSRETFLKQAPAKISAMLKVPPVIKEE